MRKEKIKKTGIEKYSQPVHPSLKPQEPTRSTKIADKPIKKAAPIITKIEPIKTIIITIFFHPTHHQQPHKSIKTATK